MREFKGREERREKKERREGGKMIDRDNEKKREIGRKGNCLTCICTQSIFYKVQETGSLIASKLMY